MSLSIAAVVLNHGTADDTILAVLSLRAADAGVRVIVVDNASADDSVCRLRKIPGIELIELHDNAGFSAGCNAGIERALAAGAGAVMLVNSDIVVPPDAPGVLCAILEQDATTGIVGPVVRKRSTPDIIESAGIRYDVTTGRMRLLENGVGSPFSRTPAPSSLPRDDAGVLVKGLPTPFTRPVDAVAGCAMMVRREVFDAIGVLREDYYFGFEDLDFCLRARQRGFNTVCCGSAFVLHEGHRSIGRHSTERAYYATRNHLLLAGRHPPDSTSLERGMRLTRVLALNLAHASRGEEMPLLRSLGSCLAGAWDYVQGRTGPRDW